jgi:hypothetical protein
MPAELVRRLGRHDREGFSFREGFSSNKTKILRDHARGRESRHRGGFKRLLLGAASTHVTHHAHCPVVVIPDDNV